MSVSLDRVSVPMEEPRPRTAGRPKKGAPKRPVERNFRMAFCGTVTLHDQSGVGGYTIRYGCMPEGDILGLRDRMVADVATLRSKRPDLKIELLCDGAPEMWNLLDEGFTPQFRRRPPPSGRFLSPDGKARRCSAGARGFGGGGRRTARRLEESLTSAQPRAD